MAESKDYKWVVIRCPLSRKTETIDDLSRQGYFVHDSFLSKSADEMEEFTIIAKRPIND